MKIKQLYFTMKKLLINLLITIVFYITKEKLIRINKNIIPIVMIFFYLFSAYVNAQDSNLPDINSGKMVLSWQEFKVILDELESLKEKEKDEKEKDRETLPVDYSILEISFDGLVLQNYVKFKTNARVEVLKDGWVTIPIFNNEPAIESITITQENTGQAQFIHSEKGYELAAKGPDTFSIEMTLMVPVQISDLLYTLDLVPPKNSVISRISVEIPEKGVHIMHSLPKGQVIQNEDSITFNTVLSNQGIFKLSWKIEKDVGLTRKKIAEILSLASVEKSSITVSNDITLKYVSTLDQVVFNLPSEVDIVNMTSPSINQWYTEKSGDKQVIKISGDADIRTPVKLSLSYRIALSSLPAKIDVPTPGVSGVDNIEGYLGVQVLGNLEVTEGQIKKGISISAKNLPKDLWKDVSNPILYGYEFQHSEFKSQFNIRRYQEIQTVVANVDIVDCITHRTLEGKNFTRIVYLIRNNDRQFLTLTLPESSRVWRAFLNGVSVKPAQNENGSILVPMKKSSGQGKELQSFSIEISYVTEVNKLSLKGDIINELPSIDIPITYLRWALFLPEYYEYSRFEGPLKQVQAFSKTEKIANITKTRIDIPTRGIKFLFEKYLLVDEKPYVRGKYGQYLGDDIFLTLSPQGNIPQPTQPAASGNYSRERMKQQQVTPKF